MDNIIYIIEDEQNIIELVSAALNSAGFKVLGFSNSKEFYKKMSEKLPILIILDVMLPFENGFDILKNIKSKPNYASVPVIFLTAKSNEIDKVHGLDFGADDFIVKPFGILELIARTKAVLRRYKKCDSNPLDEIKFDYLIINFLEKAIYKDKTKLSLTFKEYELFLYLYNNIGITLSREKILQNVWGYEYEGETRTVDAHIKTLRQKIGDNVDENSLIQTIRGHGYMLSKKNLDKS